MVVDRGLVPYYGAMMVDALIAELRRAGFSGRLEPACPLAPHTTYRVGGPAELALFPVDGPDLARALGLLARRELRPVVLGGGANVLVSDRGVAGPVLLTAAMVALEVRGAGLCCGAGVPSDRVARAALEAGLCGAAFLTALPGSIGGACFMNAKAYGGEISQILAEAEVVSPAGELRRLPLEPGQFAYKRSPFQGSGEVVSRALFALTPCPDRAALAREMDQIEATRRQKHELDHPSCGCVFKNDRRFGAPSGLLIEQSGLKGFRRGRAMVSPHHANFVFNLGGATADELHAVMETMRGAVQRRTGFELEYEVQLLGRW